MEMLTNGGGLSKDQNAQKFICFGVDGVNVFQGTKKMVLQNKFMTTMLLILLYGLSH
jgi:hypothetical protein